jgi:hypothetical protein
MRAAGRPRITRWSRAIAGVSLTAVWCSIKPAVKPNSDKIGTCRVLLGRRSAGQAELRRISWVPGGAQAATKNCGAGGRRRPAIRRRGRDGHRRRSHPGARIRQAARANGARARRARPARKKIACANSLIAMSEPQIANAIAMAAVSDASFAVVRAKPLSQWKGLASLLRRSGNARAWS